MTDTFLSQLKNASILVTGGAGFIGANLCEFLIDHGAIVTCLDNLSTGYIKNLDKVVEHHNFSFVEGDIRDENVCNNAVRGMDYVLHQAALGSVPRSINDPITSNAVNVDGFLNMLVAARDAKIKRFVYAASSSTYGDNKELPKEEDHIGKPLSPYAITKYVNELYADVFHKTYGLDCIGLRYFNVFGPKQDPKGAYAAVIPKFILQLVKHKSPVINGDGSFSRDFTYIDNVIQMNIRAMLSEKEESLNTIYNVAHGERTTLNELFVILKELLTSYDQKISDISVIYGPERVGDVPHSLASVERAKQLLGYNPKHTIKSGLEEAIDWYWNNLR